MNPVISPIPSPIPSPTPSLISAIPLRAVKRLVGRLLCAMLSPLNEASAVARSDDGAEPARRLDHPTYLRRGLCIAGLTAPVVRGQ